MSPQVYSQNQVFKINAVKKPSVSGGFCHFDISFLKAIGIGSVYALYTQRFVLVFKALGHFCHIGRLVACCYFCRSCLFWLNTIRSPILPLRPCVMMLFLLSAICVFLNVDKNWDSKINILLIFNVAFYRIFIRHVMSWKNR